MAQLGTIFPYWRLINGSCGLISRRSGVCRHLFWQNFAYVGFQQTAAGGDKIGNDVAGTGCIGKDGTEIKVALSAGIGNGFYSGFFSFFFKRAVRFGIENLYFDIVNRRSLLIFFR